MSSHSLSLRQKAKIMITSPKKGVALTGLQACITFSPLISRRAAQALAVGALLASGLHPAQAQIAYTDSGQALFDQLVPNTQALSKSCDVE